MTKVFSGGVPCRNLPLLLLAAERDDKDIFDAVLGALHQVAKIAHKSDRRLHDPNKHSGGDGIPPDVSGEVKGNQVP